MKPANVKCYATASYDVVLCLDVIENNSHLKTSKYKP